MAQNQQIVVRYRKWDYKKLSTKVGILQVGTRSRLIEILSSFPLSSMGMSKHLYQDLCLEKFIVDYTGVSDKIHQVSKSIKEIRSYKNNLSRLIAKVNPLLKPTNVYISQSNTLTLNKTDLPLTECSYWESKEESIDSLLNTDIIYQASDRSEDFSYEKCAERWKTAECTIIVKKYDKSLKPSLVFGFEPKNSYERKLYFIALCIDNLHYLKEYVANHPDLSDLPADMLVDELYKFVEEYNPWVKMRLTEFKKINNTYTSSGGRSKAQVNETGLALDTKTYKSVDKVPKAIILSLENKLKDGLFGQDEVVDSVCKRIKQAYLGVKSPQSPIGVFLFYGGTSTGKTEFARILAKELMNSYGALVKIDCNNLQLDHEITSLLGAPPGYVGYEEGGILASAINSNPFRIVLFDEVEKASPKLFDFILNIIDEGQILDKQGNLLNFTNCMFIFTSNLGQKEADDVVLNQIGFNAKPLLSQEAKVRKKEFSKILKKKLKPEFVARLNAHGGSFYFSELNRECLEKVAYKYFDVLKDSLLSNRNIEIEADNHIFIELVESLINKKPRAHARDVINEIEKDISKVLADTLIKVGFSKTKKKKKLLLTKNEEHYNAEIVNND